MSVLLFLSLVACLFVLLSVDTEVVALVDVAVVLGVVGATGFLTVTAGGAGFDAAAARTDANEGGPLGFGATGAGEGVEAGEGVGAGDGTVVVRLGPHAIGEGEIDALEVVKVVGEVRVVLELLLAGTLLEEVLLRG